MIAIDFDAVTLSRIRMAMSPTFEAASWLSATATGLAHPILGDLGGDGRTALRHPDVRMLGQIVGGYPAYIPDFLTPKPTTGRAGDILRDQLDAVAETPLEIVAENIAYAAAAGLQLPREVRRAVEDGTMARRAANGLAHFWRTALASRWPKLRDVLERDLVERGRMLTDGGIARVLRTLHTSVRWDGASLRIGTHFDDVSGLPGDDVVLSPTVLGWPHVFVDPTNSVILYPAARAGTAGHQIGAATGSRGHALDELLGESRAAVLLDLDLPRTTAQLSVRRQLAPATVSYHLTALVNAGLVLRKREGRRVLYSRSTYGDLLLEAAYGSAG